MVNPPSEWGDCEIRRLPTKREARMGDECQCRTCAPHLYLQLFDDLPDNVVSIKGRAA